MGAAYFGVRRQGREALQRAVHLLRGFFEETAAAASKKSVSAQQDVIAEVGDVPCGVARNTEYLEF